MQHKKYALTAALVIGLVTVAILACSIHSAANTPLATAFAPSPYQSINYPNPINKNVTIVGTMTSSVVSPTCALAEPPCAIANSPLYYVTVNGWNYRLIFPNSTKLPLPLNHSQISVTGIYVTPSTYQANQWSPQMYFRGDIYVTSYTYVSPYV